MPPTSSGDCREDDEPFDLHTLAADDPRRLLADDSSGWDEPWPGYPFSPENAPPDADEPFDADPWTGAGEAIAAGFLHHEDGRHGYGFAAGGVLDEMVPGPVLAGFVRDAAEDGPGLSGLGESELIGLLCATERMASWAAAQQVEAIITLASRRVAQSCERKDMRLAEHVPDEVAAALTLTSRAAGRLVDICANLKRLPEVRAALAAGIINWARAVVFADELAALDDAAARRAARRVLPRAGGMTTGQLRRALRRERELADPDAARRRREQGRKDAAVHRWDEPSGNSALAGREMTPADAITADARLTAQAKWLQAHGATGTLDQLRCAVFAAILNGRDLRTLLPRETTTPAPADANPDPSGEDRAQDSSRQAAASDAESGDAAARTASGGAGGAGATSSAAPDGPLVTGSVHLTMPMSAWLWLTDRPGEVAGSGTADAGTCRDLATQLAAHPATRWCLTLTDPDGRAVAHACARRPPPAPPPAPFDPSEPPGPTRPPSSTGPPLSQSTRPPDPGPIRAWLAGLSIAYLETTTCSHQRESRRYRPPPALRHLITIRQRTCAEPGCLRPAHRGDLDHTVPFQQGGKSCECNLGPLCRHGHRTKQAPGWHLDQPEPGLMIWTLPSGRQYTTRPEPYPI